MSDTRHQAAPVIDTRLADLRSKLARREGMPGYEHNVEVIKAEIAQLEAVDTTAEKQ